MFLQFNYSNIKVLRESKEKNKMGKAMYRDELNQVARYIGGKTVSVQDSNTAYHDEHRLLYICQFKPELTDRFIIDGKEYIVKTVEPIVDIFGDIIHYEVSVL